MKKLLLIIFTFLLINNLRAQFVIYCIQDVNQIDLSSFNDKLSQNIKENEAVIVLLPKIGNGVYKKTLSSSNKSEIPEVLTYILRMKKVGVIADKELFREATQTVLENLKEKYGSTFKYSFISYSNYELNKNAVDQNNIVTVKPESVPTISADKEYSYTDALSSALMWIIVLATAVFFAVKYFGDRKRAKNLLKKSKAFPKKDIKNTLFDDELENQKSFFNNFKDSSLNIFLVFALALSSVNTLKSQSYQNTPITSEVSLKTEDYPNIFIDNTIIQKKRKCVRDLLFKLVSVTQYSSFYLFGDSVRYLGKFNSNFGEFDSIFSKINFGDKNTGFSALLDYTIKHPGISIFLTDGKPDYFAEDLPNQHRIDSRHVLDSVEFINTNSSMELPKSLWIEPQKLVRNSFFLVGVFSGLIVFVPVFFLTVKWRRRRNLNKTRKPVPLSFVYKDLGDEKIFHTDNIRISGSRESLFFRDINFDANQFDLELSSDENNVIIKPIRIVSFNKKEF